MRRQAVLNLGGRTAGMTGKEIARLKRRLKRGPRLGRKELVDYVRSEIRKRGLVMELQHGEIR